MSYDRTFQRTTTTTGNNNNRRRRGRYTPPPPPPPGAGHQRHHSILGYWVPLLTLGTLAVGGLAAWIWSERSDHDEHDQYPPDNKPPRPPTGVGGSYPTQGSQPYPGPPPPPGGGPGGGLSYQDQGRPPPPGGPPGQYPPPPGGPPPQGGYRPGPGGQAASYYSESQSQTNTQTSRQTEERNDSTIMGRVSGVIRRTPSPQQILDSASKQVSAGVAAAGAALGSIMEEDQDGHAYGPGPIPGPRDEKDGFSDHERWSEEADDKTRTSVVEIESSKRAQAARSVREEKGPAKAKRTVAIVVSADNSPDDNVEESAYHTEHASILSHLPAQHDSAQMDMFVLIYSPGLKSLPPVDNQAGRAPSTTGSFSQISTPAVTPGEELQSVSPRIDATEPNAKQFELIYNQALSLVPNPTQILPFTTPEGYVYILRHLAPQLVYVSDTLSGREGHSVAQLKGWVGHTILVAGDEGHGGLADTETETEDERAGERKSKSRWYENSPLVGLGKDIEVVDAARIGDDWIRRVVGRE